MYARKSQQKKQQRPQSSGAYVQRRFRRLSFAQRYGSKEETTPEVKFLDTTVNVNPTNTGSVALVNGCIQGTDAINRIGRKIQLTSVQMDLTYSDTYTNMQTNGNTDTVRISLVYDKQANGSAPSYLDIYDQSGSILAPMSHRNINNLDRFEVLATGMYTISQAGPLSVALTRYVKLQHLTQFNSNNNGNVGDIQTGALYLVYADQFSAQYPTIVGRVRVRFHDI